MTQTREIAVIGSQQSGKSTLVDALMGKPFFPRYQFTLGWYPRTFTLDGESCTFSEYGGNIKYMRLVKDLFHKNSKSLIVVTIDKSQKIDWQMAYLHELLEGIPSAIPMMVVVTANETSLSEKNQRTFERGLADFCNEFNINKERIIRCGKQGDAIIGVDKLKEEMATHLGIGCDKESKSSSNEQVSSAIPLESKRQRSESQCKLDQWFEASYDAIRGIDGISQSEKLVNSTSRLINAIDNMERYLNSPEGRKQFSLEESIEIAQHTGNYVSNIIRYPGDKSAHEKEYAKQMHYRSGLSRAWLTLVGAALVAAAAVAVIMIPGAAAWIVAAAPIVAPLIAKPAATIAGSAIVGGAIGFFCSRNRGMPGVGDVIDWGNQVVNGRKIRVS